MDRMLLPRGGTPTCSKPCAPRCVLPTSSASILGQVAELRSAGSRKRTRDARRPTVQAIAAPEKIEPLASAAFLAWADAAKVKKREDIKSIMILGAGPIVIGQVRF
jgi:hypothetical protein